MTKSQHQKFIDCVSDMFASGGSYPSKKGRTTVRKCSHIEQHPSQSQKRIAKVASTNAQKRVKAPNFQCSGRVVSTFDINSGEYLVTGYKHSCDKIFTRVPQIVSNFVVDLATKAGMQIISDKQRVKKNILNEVDHTFQDTSLLSNKNIPKHVDYLLNNEINSLLEKGFKSLEEGKNFLLKYAQSRQVYFSFSFSFSLSFFLNYFFFFLKVLAWICKDGLQNCSLFGDRFALLCSLDSTHNITGKIDNNKLISLMVRMPDSLKHVVVAQALIVGEDHQSVFLFLDFVKNNLNLYPLIMALDDSSGEKSATRKVWPNCVLVNCLWHSIQCVKKHLDLFSQSIKLQNKIKSSCNFNRETLEMFEPLGKWAVKAVRTSKKETCESLISDITDNLNDLNIWWGEEMKTKISLENVKKWWNGYVKKKEEWGYCYKILDRSLGVRIACLQEKSSGRSESYHASLKVGDNKKILKKATLNISLIIIHNTTSQWNFNHSLKLKKIYYPSNIPHILNLNPALALLLPPPLQQKLLHQYSLASSQFKRKDKSWLTKVPDDVIGHECSFTRSYGLPCRHIIFFFINRSKKIIGLKELDKYSSHFKELVERIMAGKCIARGFFLKNFPQSVTNQF